MKILLMVVITAVMIASCCTLDEEGNKNKAEEGRKEKNPYMYVSNWDQYYFPRTVLVDTLKDILHKVTLYKQIRYCPFGENKCEKKHYDKVFKKIVDDAIEYYKDNMEKFEGSQYLSGNSSNVKETDVRMYNNNGRNIVDTNNKNSISMTASGDEEKLSLPYEGSRITVPYYNMVSPNIKSNMIEVLTLTSKVDDRNLKDAKVNMMAHQNLYATHYKFVKTNKKDKRPIKKFIALLSG